MEFGKAFTYPFEDQEWLKKLGIAGGIALLSIVLSVVIIGIAGFILLSGWMLEIVRRVINRDPVPLPDWNDFGGYFSKGLQAFVVGLVYSLPAILIGACVGLLPMVLGADPNSASSDAMTGTVGVVTICLNCLSALYSLFLGIVLPAALGRLAATGQIGAAFRLGDVFGLVRAAPAAYIMVLIGGILASIISSLGVILCVIGLVITIPYGMAINGHLYGQAYNVATGGRSPTYSGAQSF
jgi:hypothetical protein